METTTVFATSDLGLESTSNETPVNYNLSEDERRRYLSHLDDVNLPLMVPAIVFLAILMFVGILGNILVLIVYLKKFKPSTIKCFVLSLAVFDLMACSISLPGEILDMRFTHTFEYPILCKILRFNNTFSVVASGLTLIAVAIDRYRKICKPLKKQITIRGAQIMVIIASSVSVALTIPTVIVNGKMSVPTEKKGVYGSDCSFDDKYRGTLLPLIYTGILFLFFFGSLVVLIVMYCLIGRTVWHHRKFKFSPSGTKCQSSQNSTTETELSSNDSSRRQVYAKKYKPRSSQQKKDTHDKDAPRLAWVPQQQTTVPRILLPNQQTPKRGFTAIENNAALLNVTPSRREKDRSPLNTSQGGINKKKNKNQKKKLQNKSNKTTLMLFVITAVFITGFLPHLILMIIRGIDSGFIDTLSGVRTMVFNLFLRSYFMNSATNCIVYSFCNIRFRNECKQLLCPWRSRQLHF